MFSVLSTTDRPATKKARFRLALFMVGIFVPFMLSWNIYGNQMIKQDYFKSTPDPYHH